MMPMKFSSLEDTGDSTVEAGAGAGARAGAGAGGLPISLVL